MRNLFNILSGEKTFDLVKKASMPYRNHLKLKGNLESLTVKDVEFLQELLDVLGPGGYGKVGEVVVKHYPELTNNRGTARIYTIISLKALSFILALREGRKPTDE